MPRLVNIERIRRSEYDTFAALEQETTSPKTAWTIEDLNRELQEPNTVGMTIHLEGEIVGFLVYEVQAKKINLIHIVITKKLQRKGLGTLAVNFLKAKLSPDRRTTITAAVRESNLTAQVWLRKLGFKAFKTLRENFVDTGEDAYLFKYELEEREGVKTDQTGQKSKVT